MSNCRLYLARKPGYDAYELFFMRYYDEKSGAYHKITDIDKNGYPILTSYPFEEGDEIQPILMITGPFFTHAIGREGLEEFIESLSDAFGYVPAAFRAKMLILEKMVNRVAGSISYCARHKTFPSDNEPCWQCLHQYLDEKREELMASWSEEGVEEEKREEE